MPPFVSTLLRTLAILVGLYALGGCRRGESEHLQGYVEGEFVYVASALAGTLQKLDVQRGDRAAAGAPLFALEETAEKAARDEAERRLAQARANLEDAKKGRRPDEIAAMEAQLQQGQAALVLAEQELKRQQDLQRSGSSAKQELDRARSTWEQERQRVAQLEADLKTARLGARADQLASAEAEVLARQAALAKADWDLSQKKRTAPQAGLISDTFYREGEWVAAGRPVVALLPPRNIKVRTFVPEQRVGALQPGDAVRVRVDGVSDDFAGEVSFISPQAEYTPPVIYSRENRGKLVFLVEAVFDAATAKKLHPGQPVEVTLLPGSAPKTHEARAAGR